MAAALAAGCGAINGEHLTGTGGHSAGATGGATSTGGAGGQGGDASCVCPTIYAPVCGVDGVTYGGSCEAGCAGVAVAYQGPCVDGGTGGASGACNSDSDCVVESTGCCGQTCVVKGTVLIEPPIICNIACPIEIPPPACSCVNHQCVTLGGTGGSGGTGGAGGTSGAAGSSGAADAGGASCGELADAYAAALPAAEQCAPGDKSACQTLVSEALTPCGGCSIYVNDASTLNALQAAWLQQKCNDVPVFCPAISCLQPTSGLCVAGDGGGRCQITPGVFPN